MSLIAPKPMVFGLLAALWLAAGCARPFYRAAYEALDSDDPAELLTTADAHFGRGEYLSALRLAYRGMSRWPTDYRFCLLAGLVCDRGLDRPDLAIPEYRKAVSLRTWTDLPERLEDRVDYLRSRTLADSVARALHAPDARPLAGYPFAVCPVGVSGVGPDEGLGLAFTSMLLADLGERADSAAVPDPDVAMAAAAGFAADRPAGSAADFAAWSGARQALVCSLMAADAGRARLTVRWLGPDGSDLTEPAAAPVRVDDVQGVYSTMLRLASTDGLAASLNRAERPVPAVLPLSLYGQGLGRTVAGRLEEARALMDEAVALAPQAAWLRPARDRAVRELAGQHEREALVAAWRQVMSHPDPSGRVSPADW